jgi:aerobic-type carbon monoxide dehydrogenase small subunit (CoxS/CutS family)
MTDTPVDISITVNGVVRHLGAIAGDLSLLDLLQEELDLTGTKFGCGIGMCHACTVALRRTSGGPLEAVRACSTTVEGLAPPGELIPLQRAFLEAFAFQCGYCTPGFLMAAFVLLHRLKQAPVAKAALEAEIARACGDHVCRCTGYRRYHDAIRNVIAAQPGLTTG